MTLQVLDAKGKVLEVGSRVERVFPSGRTGGTSGHVDEIEGDGMVWVCWTKRTRLRSAFDSERRFALRRSYRCNDLIALTPPPKPNKEAALAVSERNSA